MWIKMATCPVCGKRVKLLKENRLMYHRHKSDKCLGSRRSGTDVKYESTLLDVEPTNVLVKVI